MKTIVNDWRIIGTTTVLALNFYTILLNKEQLDKFYHRYLDWADPKRSTENEIADIAQILNTYENPIQAYYKFTN